MKYWYIKGNQVVAGSSEPPEIGSVKLDYDRVIEQEINDRLAEKELVVNPDNSNNLIIQDRIITDEQYREVTQDEVRMIRLGLLQESDWTQSEDSPLTAEKKAEWLTYRQALRDLPSTQFTHLDQVTWPEYGKTLKEFLGMTDSEAEAAVLEGNWNAVRLERDLLLSECDWTQGSDVPDSIKLNWQSYRQSLRDITNQSDPLNVTWPSKPGQPFWDR